MNGFSLADTFEGEFSDATTSHAGKGVCDISGEVCPMHSGGNCSPGPALWLALRGPTKQGAG
jgi:hypothetical protein